MMILTNLSNLAKVMKMIRTSVLNPKEGPISQGGSSRVLCV